MRGVASEVVGIGKETRACKKVSEQAGESLAKLSRIIPNRNRAARHPTRKETRYTAMNGISNQANAPTIYREIHVLHPSIVKSQVFAQHRTGGQRCEVIRL